MKTVLSPQNKQFGKSVVHDRYDPQSSPKLCRYSWHGQQGQVLAITGERDSTQRPRSLERPHSQALHSVARDGAARFSWGDACELVYWRA